MTPQDLVAAEAFNDSHAVGTDALVWAQNTRERCLVGYGHPSMADAWAVSLLNDRRWHFLVAGLFGAVAAVAVAGAVLVCLGAWAWWLCVGGWASWLCTKLRGYTPLAVEEG